MDVEICQSCRRTRLVLMGLLIVFAALAGFHWGDIIDNIRTGTREPEVLVLGIIFTVLAFVTAVWVESVVARTERDAALAHLEEDRLAEEAFGTREHARALDRIVEKLSEDNYDLRYQLLHDRVQQLTSEAPRENPGPASMLPELRSKAS